ncbi:PncC family amidohydrolase [Weissella uvarum]|uniref:nicotinamide-nucleotide amidohydrolase family protein n=1 Tax=Weissella uvarum TaxID=1479233 RepID=UPI001960CD1F|nr:nicotinamide-nucleotide amidohydrolase family protein [Weissella uvarum]MBM7617128.1 PncC family amidohydrolase [Weissella uvarum]MCM0595424.1 nicotinamide-nucleotide amidohydrolase family protein [Weissella uvarum]
MQIEQELGQALIERNLTITSAESLTAGMFISQLANVRGISAVLPGAFVTYSAEAKQQLVNVSASIIDEFGVVSHQVALAMASGAKAALQTDFGVSFTGVAGPEILEGHPAGTVFIGVVGPGQYQDIQEYHFDGDRSEVRQKSVDMGMQMVLDALKVIK